MSKNKSSQVTVVFNVPVHSEVGRRLAYVARSRLLSIAYAGVHLYVGLSPNGNFVRGEATCNRSNIVSFLREFSKSSNTIQGIEQFADTITKMTVEEVGNKLDYTEVMCKQFVSRDAGAIEFFTRAIEHSDGYVPGTKGANGGPSFVGEVLYVNVADEEGKPIRSPSRARVSRDAWIVALSMLSCRLTVALSSKATYRRHHKTFGTGVLLTTVDALATSVDNRPASIVALEDYHAVVAFVPTEQPAKKPSRPKKANGKVDKKSSKPHRPQKEKVVVTDLVAQVADSTYELDASQLSQKEQELLSQPTTVEHEALADAVSTMTDDMLQQSNYDVAVAEAGEFEGVIEVAEPFNAGELTQEERGALLEVAVSIAEEEVPA